MNVEAPIDSPVFMVGAERSGTTLLGIMLDHHPSLVWAGERQFFVDFMPGGEWPEVADYAEWLSLDRGFRGLDLSIDPEASFPEVLRSFLRQEAARAGKPFAGTTVHKRFDRLAKIWPQARYIHFVRDPRDVARSVIQMGWAGTTWTAVERWLAAERLWDEFRRTLEPERTIEVRFEALMEDPPGVLEDLCQFIGIPYDDAMLSYPEDTTYGPPDPAIASTWRRKASDQEVRLVEAHVGELLTARGYEPSGLPRLEVRPADIRRFQLQDRWARIRHKLEVYGAGLYVGELLTRRLGLRALHRHFDLRMQAITDSHLK